MSRYTEQYQLDDARQAIRDKNDTDLVDTLIKVAEVFALSQQQMKDNRGDVEQDLLMYRDEVLIRILYNRNPPNKELFKEIE